MRRICDLIAGITEAALSIGFFGLIVTVSVQVIGRVVFSLPVIWTMDIAQLLFTWLIFSGAAIALRRHAHYTVDIFPPDRPVLNRILSVLSVIAALIVAYILIIPGWNLATLRWSAVVPSVGISMFWLFLALPFSGVLMALFTLEHAAAVVAGSDFSDHMEERE